MPSDTPDSSSTAGEIKQHQRADATRYYATDYSDAYVPAPRPALWREVTEEVATLRAALTEARADVTTAVANTAREQQRAEKAEAERDAMRPVVEAACSYADLGHRPTLHDYEHRSGDKRIKEAVDAYREATRG